MYLCHYYSVAFFTFCMLVIHEKSNRFSLHCIIKIKHYYSFRAEKRTVKFGHLFLPEPECTYSGAFKNLIACTLYQNEIISKVGLTISLMCHPPYISAVQRDPLPFQEQPFPFSSVVLYDILSQTYLVCRELY